MFVQQINILTLPLIISSAKSKITEMVKLLHKMTQTKIATYLGHRKDSRISFFPQGLIVTKLFDHNSNKRYIFNKPDLTNI